MHNPFQTQSAKIAKIKDQAANIKLFEFELEGKSKTSFDFQPGQIFMLSIPGFGEAPFAACNKPESPYLELAVRKVGRLTEKLHSMKIGEKVGIRGPYGQGWPIGVLPSGRDWSPAKAGSPRGKKNLLIVVGGLGLIPLRTLILGKDKFLSKETKVQIFYGTRAPKDFLFKDEFDAWRKNGIDLQLTIDKKCSGWDGCVGVVTVLFDKVKLVENAIAFLCGPPVMYKFVLEKLREHQFKEEDIYLSLERRMYCGVGVCQHCAVGSYYTCQDGPVFKYSQIKNIVGAI